jgi:non-ribosomal peptide synthetase component E (peptide arylation enzyme)
MAEVKNTTIEKLVTKTEKVPAYTLTLTKEEALALMVLAGNVTGSSTDSPRKHTDAVYRAFTKAGLSIGGSEIQRQYSGSARFVSKAPTYRF